MPWTTPSIALTDNPFKEEGSVRTCSYREAIREAQELMLAADSQVFLLGEGVDDLGGIFGTTLGLAGKFGKERIIDSPLAENGMTGVAVGAALAGMRPVFVHMRPDFLILSLDQLLNHAAKWHYMSGGKVTVPLTVRCVIGRGWGSAAQHSQSVQGLLTHLPGIKVVMPATAHDAKGLLIAAIRDPNPVVLFEHRWLFDRKGYVPEEIYEIPIGRASFCRSGSDLTIVGTSLMVHEAMQAAQQLDGMGISAEVVDLRSVKPWDEDAVCASVRKTGRLLVADTGHQYGGVAAEVCARVVEREFGALRVAPRRITLPEAPVPAASVLEELYFPGWQDIVSVAQEMCHG